jgi:hypothetical protein
MEDFDAMEEEKEYTCESCGNDTFKVTFTNYRKLAEEQSTRPIPPTDANGRIPTEVAISCAKCEMHALTFPMNTSYNVIRP